MLPDRPRAELAREILAERIGHDFDALERERTRGADCLRCGGRLVHNAAGFFVHESSNGCHIPTVTLAELRLTN